MRVDVGAGRTRRPGYVSIDADPDSGADHVAMAWALPIPDGQVVHLIAADVLEHVLPWQVEATLAEWRRVLQPGGRATIRVPNLAELGRRLWRGEDLGDTIRNIYGGHRWGPDGRWDQHHHGWTPERLEADVAAAGLVVIDNDRAANMTINARKP